MSKINDEIEKLQKEAEMKKQEAERLATLQKEFPNLQKHVGRWGKVAYYSKDVNEKVDKFDMRHNCGCCSDSPLEIWPYLETSNGKVYSDPPKFFVGEKHWIAGDFPYDDWDEKLRTASLPEDIIGAISVYFEECAQNRRQLADD